MKSRVIWYTVALSFIIAAVAVNILPNEIPAHYNFEGVVDRMGSKYEVFIYPVMIAGMALFWEVFIGMFRKKLKNATEEKEIMEAKSNMKVLIITGLAVSLMQVAFQVYGMIKAYHYDEQKLDFGGMEMYSLLGIITGVVFVVVGNVLPKVKRNSVLGVRTKWSMANDETWLASNRMGGFLLCIGGIVLIVTALLCKGMTALWIMTGIIIVILVIVTVYSYIVYKKKNG